MLMNERLQALKARIEKLKQNCRLSTKLQVFKFQPFPLKQKKVLTWWCDTSPVKDKDGIIADGAIRSGKTVCMSLSFIMWAMQRFKWYWFNAAGIMVTNTWYQYNSVWYYLGPDGAMCQSQLVESSGKIYAVDSEGKMITEPVTLKPDKAGALQYPGLA